MICRFMKGVSRIKPPAYKYNNIWDPSPVLTYLKTLEPLETISLSDLTLKLVSLLSLVTAHRVQTFASIKVADIQRHNNGVEIYISTPIKTTKPHLEQPCLFLPKFSDHPEWCAVRVLSEYLNRVSPFRGNTEQLFLSFNPPHQAVSSQTISRWIKAVLTKSGIDTNVFTAHSTRHAATSAAHRRGVNIELIRTRAGWTQSSSVFAKFYNRPLDNRADFASSLIYV